MLIYGLDMSFHTHIFQSCNCRLPVGFAAAQSGAPKGYALRQSLRWRIEAGLPVLLADCSQFQQSLARTSAFCFFPPTAESFGVSAQIGSGVVRGGPEVRFHEGSTRDPPWFHEVLRGLRGGASTKIAPHAVGDIT